MYENKEELSEVAVDHDNAIVVYEPEEIAVETRTLEDIAVEIKKCKSQIEQDFVRLGALLNEAKAIYGTYGNWGAWLKGNFDLSQTTATRLMNIAREYANSPSLQNLGLSRTKADALLKLDDQDRKRFIISNDVENMTTKELTKSIRKFQGLEGNGEKAKSYINTKMSLGSISDVQMNIDYLRECLNKLTDHFLEHSDNDEMFDISFELRNLCSDVTEKLPPKLE